MYVSRPPKIIFAFSMNCYFKGRIPQSRFYQSLVPKEYGGISFCFLKQLIYFEQIIIISDEKNTLGSKLSPF